MRKNTLPRENIYGHTKKLNFILKHIEDYKNQKKEVIKILDFGCGNGTAVSQFIIQDKVLFYGIDIHDNSINYAKANFGSEKAFFLNEIPEGILFDIIIYADVLEHLENPIDILSGHNKILKERGIILGSIPNGYGPFEIEKKITKFLKIDFLTQSAIKVKRKMTGRNSISQEIPYNIDSGHLQFFTKRKLMKLLKESGFELQSFEKGSFLGAPFSERILSLSQKVINLNVKIADKLPYWTVSTWYFKAQKL